MFWKDAPPALTLFARPAGPPPERGRGGVKKMFLVLVVVSSASGLGSLGPVGHSPGSCEQ